ncbi:hypothetical protein ACFP1Z_22865 [Streptomyces gamaensis]|uniref:Gram-positive cocci surface proteins LPxTG domain-containing protein n=1 Tax=Streptomyces gamaensis TaxID=1763542 RepID=A0ABW0Z4X2_9ACTN
MTTNTPRPQDRTDGTGRTSGTSGTARTRKAAVTRTALTGGALAAALLGAAPLAQAATPVPAAPQAPAAASIAAAHDAAAAPATLDTLSRFFTRDGDRGDALGGAQARAKAQPRIEGDTVPVYALSPDFVAGKEGAPVAALEVLASKAVAADGQKASVWAAETGGSWKVVNIATGDDETRYAAEGARRLSGGTVFREPQINAWYVQRGDKVLPLSPDAVRAVGENGTTVEKYQDRVHRAYGDKLPGSAYAKKGLAGGYDTSSQGSPDTAVNAAAPGPADSGGLSTTATAATAAGAALTLGAGALVARRLRRR